MKVLRAIDFVRKKRLDSVSLDLLRQVQLLLLGFGIKAKLYTDRRVGPLTAVGMAAQQTGGAALMVLKGLQLMMTGRVPLRDLGGPIAIASAAGKQARAGGRYYLFTLAFLSVNLAVLNLLPIPALDGGHLAFFAIEGAMRRPLRARHREIALQVGILLLITLIVFVSYNDIHRLVWG